jgi:prepilin-type N-terminal cleavage/methylation domain-containing protein
MEAAHHAGRRGNGEPAVRPFRPALTLLEMLIVLAIIGTLMGLMMPAIGRAYRRANDAVCMNNLRQMGLALAEYRDGNKRIPLPAKPGLIGGWAIELLPFLEQGNLYSSLKPDTSLASAPQAFVAKPRIYRCPFGPSTTGPGGMDYSAYVLVPSRDRKWGMLVDAPVGLMEPWAGGPEIPEATLNGKKGPHGDKFFTNQGQTLPASP